MDAHIKITIFITLKSFPLLYIKLLLAMMPRMDGVDDGTIGTVGGFVGTFWSGCQGWC